MRLLMLSEVSTQQVAFFVLGGVAAGCILTWFVLKLRANSILKATEQDAKRLTDEASRQLLQKIENELEQEVAELIDRRLNEANETAEQKCREIIITAIQRFAASHSADSTVSTVAIPSDDMKGRVIGREGRNIRA